MQNVGSSEIAVKIYKLTTNDASSAGIFNVLSNISYYGQLPRQGNYLAGSKQRVLISYNLVLHLFCQNCLGEGKFVESPQQEMLRAKVNTTTRPKLRGEWSWYYCLRQSRGTSLSADTRNTNTILWILKYLKPIIPTRWMVDNSDFIGYWWYGAYQGRIYVWKQAVLFNQ